MVLEKLADFGGFPDKRGHLARWGFLFSAKQATWVFCARLCLGLCLDVAVDVPWVEYELIDNVGGGRARKMLDSVVLLLRNMKKNQLKYNRIRSLAAHTPSGWPRKHSFSASQQWPQKQGSKKAPFQGAGSQSPKPCPKEAPPKKKRGPQQRVPSESTKRSKTGRPSGGVDSSTTEDSADLRITGGRRLGKRDFVS